MRKNRKMKKVLKKACGKRKVEREKEVYIL
jgi:hypothetical protein